MQPREMAFTAELLGSGGKQEKAARALRQPLHYLKGRSVVLKMVRFIDDDQVPWDGRGARGKSGVV